MKGAKDAIRAYLKKIELLRKLYKKSHKRCLQTD